MYIEEIYANDEPSADICAFALFNRGENSVGTEFVVRANFVEHIVEGTSVLVYDYHIIILLCILLTLCTIYLLGCT